MSLWPTSPAPKYIQWKSYSPTRISMPHSLTRNVRTEGAHLWGVRLTYMDILTRDQVAPFWAFAESLQGQYGTFSWLPPVLYAPRGAASGSPITRNRVNLFDYSEDFTEWTAGQATQGTGATGPAACGYRTAQEWHGDGAAGSHLVYKTGYTFASYNVYSIYLKYHNSTFMQIRLYNSTTPTDHYVNLAYAAGSWSISGTSNADGSGIESLGSGWYRAWIYVDGTTRGIVGESMVAYCHICADGANTYGAYIIGADLETGSDEPCNYLYTSGTAYSSEDQSGLTLYTDGWTDSTANILKAGDFIKCSGHNKIYQVTADVNSDANGCAAVSIKPALRTPPGDWESITANGATFNMALASDIVELPQNNIGRYGFEVEFIEVP